MLPKLIRNQEVIREDRGWGPMLWPVSGKICPDLGLTVGRVTIHPGAQVPLHCHLDSDEVLHVLSGSLLHQVPGHVDTQISTGETVLLRKGGAHGGVNTGQEPCELLVLCDTGERRMEKNCQPSEPSHIHQLRAGEAESVATDWGSLRWIVSGRNETSASITFGIVVINAGRSNPHHCHPNCDEILYLLSGSLAHTFGTGEVTMNPGDAIAIPRGEPHHARNDGRDAAVMAVVYNSAWREVENE